MQSSLRGRPWLGIIMIVSASIAPASGTASEPVGQRLADFMHQAAAEGFTGGVIVAQGNKLLLREGYGERVPGTGDAVMPDTVSTTGSITKQFTAAAVMLLEQQGALAVTDSLGDWFDDVPADKASITLHQLLSHQSGLPPAIGPDDERIDRGAWLQRAFAAELLFPPGDGYEYSNVGYSVAAAIIELASGDTYESFLRQHFFAPLGMSDTGYRLSADAVERLAHGHNRDGGDWGSVYENFIAGGGPGWNLVGNGGIHSTLDDMLRWHRALQDGSILDDKSTAKLYGHHAAEPGGTWYGYGWVTEEAPWGATMITHNGGNPYFFADYLRFPEDDVVIYLWTTSRQARLKDLSRPLASIVYGGPVPALQPPPPPLMAIDTNTPVGAVAARMLEIVVGDDPRLRAELMSETIHPELLDKHGATKIADLAASVREEIGDYRLLGIRQYPDDRVDIEFDTVQGVFALELGLQDRQGPMVRSIGLRIGD